MGSLRKIWWIINVLILLCILAAGQRQIIRRNPRVKTDLGKLIGRYVYVDDYISNEHYIVNEFLAVPYAQPPIGNLRFLKPVPYESWNSTLKCRIMADACVQYTAIPWPWRLADGHMDEDCLYMNIWTPTNASSENKKSVLFFIHGGDTLDAKGGNRQPIYEGQVLSAIGDIVVVVPNYRVGTIGFWTASNPWQNNNVAPGNAGLWDIIEALKWVNTHIENFGGDKDSITIAGQGFGSVVVSLLSIAQQAKTLYKRQIMQSGSAMWEYGNYLPQNYLYNHQIAERLGCALKLPVGPVPQVDQMTNCMLGAHATELEGEEAHPDLRRPIYPTYRDELFSDMPRRLLMNASFQFKELLIGLSGNEGIRLLTPDWKDILGYYGEKDGEFDDEDFYQEFLTKRFHDFTGINKTYDLRLSADRCFIPSAYSNPFLWRRKTAEVLGDRDSACPTIYYARASVRSGVNVYFYNFQYRPSKSVWAEWVGTTLFDEVDFVFGGPFKTYSNYPKAEMVLSKTMMTHWSNFVKYGKPSDDWPIFKDEYHPYEKIEGARHYSKIMTYVGALKTTQIYSNDFHFKECQYWSDFIYPKYESYVVK